ADLPASPGIVETLFEPHQLLVLRNMEKELEDGSIVSRGEQVFEIVNQAVTLRPYACRNQVVNARYQHILVVRAVEHRHFPPGGHVRMNAPEEIVSDLSRSGLLESHHAAAGRIGPAEN